VLKPYDREWTHMEPTRELIDEIYRERVLRARRTPPEEKILEGPRLFEMACRITMEGIREQHPEASDAEVREILERRLDLRDRLDGLR
jgi:hypothetical protein